MKIFFANDCQNYHGGSWAVSQVIRQQIAAAGHELICEANLQVFDELIVSECDAILVNGEGTMHDDVKRAHHLLRLLRFGQQQGRFTALINTSWHAMSPEFDDVLRGLDHISVREVRSLQELETRHGIKAELHLDLSYDFEISSFIEYEKQPLLMTDLYSKEFDCYVILNGGARSKVPLLNMKKASWSETLDQISRHSFFVTGRFHGLMAALKTRTPFAAYPSNTHKINGVLETLGGLEFLGLEYKNLFPLAARWKHHRISYKKIFDAAAAMPKWCLPKI